MFGMFDKIVDVWYEIKFIVFLLIAIYFLYKVLEGYLKPEKENSSKKIIYLIFLCVFVILSSLSGWKYLHRSDEKKLENVVSDNKKMKLKIEGLEKQNESLKFSQAQISALRKILETSVVEIPIKQKQVWYENFGSPTISKSYLTTGDKIEQKKSLVVNLYDITLKLGISLDELKVKRQGNGIVIKGIRPKVTSTELRKKENMINEIRTEVRRKNDVMDVLSSVEVVEDKYLQAEARRIEGEQHNKYMESLRNIDSDELKWIKDIVFEQGKTFIKLLLSSHYEKIDFIEDNSGDDAGFVNLWDFLQNEGSAMENQINEVKKAPAPVQLESPVSL